MQNGIGRNRLLTGIYNIRYPVKADGKELRVGLGNAKLPKAVGEIKVPRYKSHYLILNPFWLRRFYASTGKKPRITQNQPLLGGTYAR